MSKADDKRQDYERAMASRRPKVVEGFDPLAGALSALTTEMRILERLGPAWDVKFVQLSVGAGVLNGGLYVAYDGAGKIKAVVHPERFSTTLDKFGQLNFWSQHLINGFAAAQIYAVPFVVVAEFDDGNMWHMRPAADDIKDCRVGSRIASPLYGEDVVNAIIYVDTTKFKPVKAKT